MYKRSKNNGTSTISFMPAPHKYSQDLTTNVSALIQHVFRAGLTIRWVLHIVQCWAQFQGCWHYQKCSVLWYLL